MVTQLLFGECYEVLESGEKWLLIRNLHDHYQCWIDAKQHHSIDAEIANKLLKNPQKRCGDAIGQLRNSANQVFAIPCASLLPAYHEGFIQVEEQKYAFDGRVARHDSDSIIRHARRLLHAPYLWGGKSVFGIDCSGLVQVICACAGIYLPRDAWQQAEFGDAVDFVDLLQKGDILFFDNEEGRIHHVGIAMGEGKIIHASGSVRIDLIDHQGIYVASTGKYTHKLRLIRRYNPGHYLPEPRQSVE